jgi:hypothetical protein
VPANGTTGRTAAGSGERFLEIRGRTPACSCISEAPFQLFTRGGAALASAIEPRSLLVTFELVVIVLEESTERVFRAP